MTSDDADLGEELVRLASADNFRDLAGPGYPTADGRRVRRGVLFRSNELTLTHEDAQALAALGVETIFDLRDAHEIEAHPDAPVPGATWRHVEVKGIPMEAVASLQTHEQGLAVMGEVYRGFVEKEGGRAAFGELLHSIAQGRAAQVFHCTAGKDRTGWASVLLLHVAGVAPETILEDYLATNTISSATRVKYLGMVREHLGDDKVEVYETVMVADARYLQQAYDAVVSSYGSMEGYLADGLGLGADTLAALRARLLDHGVE
ncbi:protein-tyrosine-phosphatase [Nocardioides psychrotolerans]|uniref:Protein-tyrosine phosphatase n=1 Tax=Nocardioides psychrotolerans TaxID=1005945 RepID=A0A1I3ECR5_9ACTN|nr:tyrosine-protein phosphatase [Nocardioides psychrotolerans]GEP37422.1 protein-tyrosine-phosphatase [Nocardioides psychrotolerans]SFH96764.1 protein-tyrosine phosphatase [Nocardioides psychrotolerans]